MKGKAGTGVGSYGAIGRACGAGRAMGLLYSTLVHTWLNCSCVPTVNDYRTHWTLRSAYIDMGLVEVGSRWTDGVRCAEGKGAEGTSHGAGIGDWLSQCSNRHLATSYTLRSLAHLSE